MIRETIPLLCVLLAGCRAPATDDQPASPETPSADARQADARQAEAQPTRTQPTEVQVVEARSADAASTGPILTGTIVDENGRPMPDVEVILYGGLATRFRGQQTTTDADGRYRFDPLTTGARMGASKEKGGLPHWAFFVGMQLRHATHVSADGHSWWDETVLGMAGHVHARDFVMVPGGILRGTVIDADTGAPIPDLGLRVWSGEDPGASFFCYVETAADGTFRSDPLFPGEYIVDVNSPLDKYPVLATVRIDAGGEVERHLSMKSPPTK